MLLTLQLVLKYRYFDNCAIWHVNGIYTEWHIGTQHIIWNRIGLLMLLRNRTIGSLNIIWIICGYFIARCVGELVPYNKLGLTWTGCTKPCANTSCTTFMALDRTTVLEWRNDPRISFKYNWITVDAIPDDTSPISLRFSCFDRVDPEMSLRLGFYSINTNLRHFLETNI